LVYSRRRGLIQIYTGNGKGKTTAAFGLALRMVGSGGKVLIIQFMKERMISGEVRAIQKCGVEVRRFGLNFVGGQAPDMIKLKESVRKGIVYAARQVDKGVWDMVILDEALVALSMGLLPLEAVFALLSQKNPHVELVLTGRNAPAELIAVADLVTEMNEIKHPYQQGIHARKGIEY